MHPWIGITKSILTSHFLLTELYAINYISSNKTEILIFCVLSCFTTMTIRKKSIFSFVPHPFIIFWFKCLLSVDGTGLFLFLSHLCRHVYCTVGTHKSQGSSGQGLILVSEYFYENYDVGESNQSLVI